MSDMGMVTWQEPPSETDPAWIETRYDLIARELLENPGRWALVEEDTGILAGDHYRKRGLEVRRVHRGRLQYDFYARAPI